MSIKVTWLGHACFAVETAGHLLLVDPFLNDSPTAPITADDAEADFILLTHGHFDHVADAPALALHYNVPIRAPGDLNQTLSTLGVLPANLLPRMNKGGTITPAPGIKVTAVRAEHSSIYVWRNPASNKDDPRNYTK